MFAPLGCFLCKVCKSKLYDAKDLQVVGDTFVFKEACQENLHIFCRLCNTALGTTRKDEHVVYAYSLVYFSS